MKFLAKTVLPDRRNLIAGIACVVLLAIFFLTAWRASLGKCATFDEPLHFIGAWTETHFNDFRCNPEDPPLWKYYVAIGTRVSDLKIDRTSDLWKQMLHEISAPAAYYVMETLYQTPGNDANKLIRAARVRMLFLGVIMGVAIAWWAWRLRGPIAGVVALAAFCLDPNFLAHAPLIKNDVPMALIFLLLMGSIWLLGERASIFRLASVTIFVGIGLTTKFSGLLAFPMIGIALICRVLIDKPWPFLKWTLSTRRLRLVAAAGVMASAFVVGFVMIWGSFKFRFLPSPSPNAVFNYSVSILNCAESEMLLRQDPIPIYPSNTQVRQWVADWKPSAIVRAVKVANTHHLLPQSWLAGFLYTYGTSLARRTFLCGEIGVTGWWYYFPAAMAFKTPLSTLVGLGLATIFWFLHFRRRSAKGDSWATYAVLVGPVFYMIVAMRSHLNIGLRHIFPVYPFLFIFLGVMAAQSFARRPKMTGWVIAILFLGLACETFAAYPNYIPFFNVAVGGSRGGLALLSDSNIDWGQDLPALAQWQREHSDRQLYFCHFGNPDPVYYGLNYIEMDGSQLAQTRVTRPSGLLPVYAISAVALQGPYMTTSQMRIYRGFMAEKPIEVLNGSTYLYDKAPNVLFEH